MTMKGAFLAAAAFGFLSSAASGLALAGDKDGGDQIICDGINSCKGTGSCAGAGHGCGGQNACKGQGHTKTSKKECMDKGGKVVEAKNDKAPAKK
jgi:hypothetical protein